MMSLIKRLREDSVKARPSEEIIVEAMEQDGFVPPQKGESRAIYMKKIADYLLHLRRRANDLETSSYDK